MLRIAIWYENRLGRNDGNPLYVQAALKRLEKQGKLLVDHLIPTGDTSHFGRYDAHVWVDWGEDGLTSLLPYKVKVPQDAPLVYWASDTHLGYDYRFDFAKRYAQATFCAQKDAAEKFQASGLDAAWLPHAVEPRAYNDEDDPTGTKPYNFITKKQDVCFIGHVNSDNRVEALDRLFREFPNFFYGQKLFNEAAKKYAESKIVFNISMKNELNMRTFEVMGSKSLLLTDRCATIEELFQDGKHLVLYDSMEEMVKKARYYIEHDDEREAIAQAGYEEVMKKHTIDHRVSVMLDKINELVKEKAHV